MKKTRRPNCINAHHVLRRSPEMYNIKASPRLCIRHFNIVMYMRDINIIYPNRKKQKNKSRDSVSRCSTSIIILYKKNIKALIPSHVLFFELFIFHSLYKSTENVDGSPRLLYDLV